MTKCPRCRALNATRRYRLPIVCNSCASKKGPPEWGPAKRKLRLWELPFKEDMVPEKTSAADHFRFKVTVGKQEVWYYPVKGTWCKAGGQAYQKAGFWKMVWNTLPKSRKIVLTMMGICPEENNGWGPASSSEAE